MTETITIEEIMAQPPFKVVEYFKSRRASRDLKKYIDQYDANSHAIHDTLHRPNKIVKVDDDITKSVPVARLSVPFQKLIVDRAAAFLIGEGVKIIADPASDAEQQLLQAVKKAWHDNKCDYKTRQMARTWMSETEVAEYWYVQKKDKEQRLRMQVWSHSASDHMYPYFDEYGDMVAFARGYTIGRHEYMDVWTADRIYNYESEGGLWQLTKDEPNLLNKIPVIYYTREDVEWEDVQPLIERFEKMISDYADANDYFSSPLVFVKGEITGFAEKGEQGKMITGTEGADVRYITWDQAPEAIKLEKETLQELIFSMTQTPDISFQQMKGLGASVSGIALRLMFMDASLKSLRHQEEFGEGIQRRINLMQHMIKVIEPGLAQDMSMEPEFTFYMPGNDEELIRMLVTATGGRAILSRKTAIENNPFVMNAEREQEDVMADEAGDFGNIVP